MKIRGNQWSRLRTIRRINGTAALYPTKARQRRVTQLYAAFGA